MRVFVSAAEISSDIQAEKIIRSLQEFNPERGFEFFGIGGPALRSVPGFTAVERAESLRAMGFVEVLSKFFLFRRTLNRIEKELDRKPPDVILTFDYPDFHFSLMKRLRNRPWFRGTLRICGIPPKVWVWRSGRVERIRELYHGVWVIFPFEKEFYEQRGIPVIYEGNPLIASIVSGAAPKEPLMTDDVIRMAVLPGSREGELKAHLPLVGPALEEFSQVSGKIIHAEVPVPAGIDEKVFGRELISSERVHYRLIPGGSAEVLSRNCIGLVKSGTSTLEAAVLGCVPVIFYRMNPLSEWIFKRWVGYAGPVGLPNILLGVKSRARAVFPELLGADARPDLLATELFRLVDQPEYRERLAAQGMQLLGSLVPSGSVSRKIAGRISEWMEKPPARPLRRRKRIWIACVSFLWSLANRWRRRLRSWTGIRAESLPVRSILVGNLQAGGAGKTPVVIAIAKAAMDRGLRVGVVSRGYGRARPGVLRWVEPEDDVREVGDEPAEIKAALPAVGVVLSKDRVEASKELMKRGVDLIIADDGYQNLKFKTDLTVLLVTDADRSSIPYRDFDSEAGSADLLIQTKGAPTPRFPHARRLEWTTAGLPEGPLWLWTAIADPEELLGFYEDRGLRFQRVITARDHAFPDPGMIRGLLESAESAGARLAVTAKDGTKLDRDLRDRCVILRRNPREGTFFNSLFEGLQ
jgi:lipid-A-disaccharide synthase